MPIEIRNADPSEYREAVEVVATAFLDRPDIDRLADAVRSSWIPARTWIALDGGKIAGVFRSWPTELTVPGGGRLPVAAVGPVTVLPTHRRRGILRGLAAADDRAIRVRGEAAALLHASEFGIYGRYGYGPATRSTDWTIRTIAAGGVHGTPKGSIELLPPTDQATRDTLKAVFEAWRARQAGEILRRDLDWDLYLGIDEAPWGHRWKGWVAVHRDEAGAADGYVRYTGESKEEDLLPNGVLKVDELVGLTDAAYADLLRYVLGVDLIRTVKLENRAESERARWLVRNARAVSDSASWDSMWVRLFDVRAALEARAYERESCLVLEVVDEGAVGGRVRLELDASPDGSRCTPTDRSPDLTLPVAALGAAYLGGTRLRDITVGTGADEHRAGALAQADALLRTSEEPSCSSHF
jgi:predicted acetyltransferase